MGHRRHVEPILLRAGGALRPCRAADHPGDDHLPERTQAWTVSALLRAFLAQEEEPIPTPTPLEKELLVRGATERLRGSALAAAFPTSYGYRVDAKRAQAIEREILEQATGLSFQPPEQKE
jgi:hypothetical protein